MVRPIVTLADFEAYLREHGLKAQVRRPIHTDAWIVILTQHDSWSVCGHGETITSAVVDAVCAYEQVRLGQTEVRS